MSSIDKDKKMGTFEEVWQIRLALVVFLMLTNWLGYLGISYCQNKVRAENFWYSLLVPVPFGLLLLWLTSLTGISVGEQVGIILILILISIMIYGLLLVFDEKAARKIHQDTTIANGVNPILVPFLCSVLVVMQLIPLSAYAINISSYSFKREALKVKFPEILCYPKAIHTVIVENEIVYQVWAEYSTYTYQDKEIEDKNLIIEKTAYTSYRPFRIYVQPRVFGKLYSRRPAVCIFRHLMLFRKPASTLVRLILPFFRHNKAYRRSP
jgi:hypothetical protein